MLSAGTASGESAPDAGEPELRRESGGAGTPRAPWQDTASARVPLLLDAECEEHDAAQSGSEQHAGWSGGETLLSLLVSLTLPLYIPMLLLFFAWGLVTPILPLFAASLGAGTAAVGVVSASRAVGSLLATLPSGLVVQRGGVRSATLVGTVTYFLACGWGGAASGVVSLAASRCLAGAGYSLYSLAQQTFVRQVVPAHFRGRVLASVGGAYRIGGLLAPLCGGILAQCIGFRAVFALQAAVSGLAVPFIALRMRQQQQVSPAPSEASGDAPLPQQDAHLPLVAFLRANWRPVGAAWAATVLMSVVRSVRDLLIPLAAAAAGFSRANTGYVTAASYAGDTLLFPLGGWIMDTCGCWAAGALSCSVMALGMLLLVMPASTGPHAGAVLYTAALVTGVGNGLSSGIVMALASSMAPGDGRAGPIIASYNFVAALGGVLGPVLVGGLAQAHGLRAGAAFATVTAALGGGWWGLALPRPSPRKGLPSDADEELALLPRDAERQTS